MQKATTCLSTALSHVHNNGHKNGCAIEQKNALASLGLPVAKVVSTVVLFTSTTNLAHAYLDLGTGSFILQAALAGLAATGLACSTYWQKIKSLFQKKTVEPEKSNASNTVTHESD